MSTLQADNIPTVDTERLVLRGLRRDDFDDYAAMWGDPAVTRYIGGEPLARETAWAKFLRDRGHWALLGFGYWAIEERAPPAGAGARRLAGVVGFADYQRDIEPRLDGRPELGYVLAPWAMGRGIATEAARAVVAWGRERFGPIAQVCLIHADNAASLRVAHKCGFQESARTTYHGDPTVVLTR